MLQGSFRLCSWLSLQRLVSWINDLPPACWSTFWKSNFKQQLGCRFDIMDNESYFCFVFWHMQLYMPWYIRSFFGFTFLNILYFVSSTLVVTPSIDVVFIFSVTIFQNLTLKFKGQSHGWGYSSKSQSGSNILSTHDPFVPCQSAPLSWDTAFSKFDLENQGSRSNDPHFAQLQV